MININITNYFEGYEGMKAQFKHFHSIVSNRLLITNHYYSLTTIFRYLKKTFLKKIVIFR